MLWMNRYRLYNQLQTFVILWNEALSRDAIKCDMEKLAEKTRFFRNLYTAGFILVTGSYIFRPFMLDYFIMIIKIRIKLFNKALKYLFQTSYDASYKS